MRPCKSGNPGILMLSVGPGAIAVGREGAAALMFLGSSTLDELLLMLGSMLDGLLSKTGRWISGGVEDEQIAENPELVAIYGIPDELPGTSARVTAEFRVDEEVSKA
jgi:hypothetical protein